MIAVLAEKARPTRAPIVGRRRQINRARGKVLACRLAVRLPARIKQLLAPQARVQRVARALNLICGRVDRACAIAVARGRRALRIEIGLAVGARVA